MTYSQKIAYNERMCEEYLEFLQTENTTKEDKDKLLKEIAKLYVDNERLKFFPQRQSTEIETIELRINSKINQNQITK